MTKSQVFGLAGGSCSGKTTLFNQLKGELGQNATFLSFDDYFMGEEALQGRAVTDWESPAFTRYNDFVNDVAALKRGEPIQITTKSRDNIKAGISELYIEPKSLIIVEGFLIFWSAAARNLFDEHVYIELSEVEIINRRMSRAEPDSPWDTVEYINNKLLPGHRRYVLPQRQFASLILDGREPTEQLTGTIASHIL